MKKEETYSILSNEPLTQDVCRMVLKGDTTWVEAPGQFVNLTIDGLYLRRPISVCDWTDDTLTLIYKVVGKGTAAMKEMKPGSSLTMLVGLGNGYRELDSEDSYLVIGGGVGVPPMYGLAKALHQKGKQVTAILGFNRKEEIFYAKEFEELGISVWIATADGSVGMRGFVTDVMKEKGLLDLPYMTCGPMPMLKAVYQTSNAHGYLSFEERMGCGFGACMGCSCETITGYKRICTEGPVLSSEELLWTKDCA